MSQINVNAPPPRPDDGGGRAAAAGINLVTVLIVLAVLAVVAWFLFTGPLKAVMGGSTTVNVNQPAQQQAPNVNVNVPAQPTAKP
jgi:hypothetical protein